MVVSSISFDQDEIIQNIINLHLKGKQIECDPTYSKGYFYKNIQPPKYKFDINPQTPDTIACSAVDLPFIDHEISSLMFDPPFLATTGPSLKSTDANNYINKRFGVFASEKLLHEFYESSLAEFYRVLDRKGILIFKCQDKVSSGKQWFSHILIHQMAEKIGFYALDLFILLAKNRIVADWQKQNQKHARKYHSYFWVFIKK